MNIDTDLDGEPRIVPLRLVLCDTQFSRKPLKSRCGRHLFDLDDPPFCIREPGYITGLQTVDIHFEPQTSRYVVDCRMVPCETKVGTG
jgi:hypothetical protein